MGSGYPNTSVAPHARTRHDPCPSLLRTRRAGGGRLTCKDPLSVCRLRSPPIEWPWGTLVLSRMFETGGGVTGARLGRSSRSVSKGLSIELQTPVRIQLKRVVGRGTAPLRDDHGPAEDGDERDLRPWQG